MMPRWFLFFWLLTAVCLADTSRVGNNSALIIIDMQESFITRGGNADDPGNVRKVNDITERQIELIRVAREQNLPVVFIEYANHGPTNPRLKEAARGYANVRTFEKTSDGMLDGFNSNLAQLSEYLRENEIGNLIIAGANGGACVYMSISGALQNNYNVIAYSRGIADFNFEEFVYPYDDLYTGFVQTECPNCFREVDDLPTLSLLMASPRRPASAAAVNDSDRSVPRADTSSEVRQRRERQPATVPQ